jgi:hypothetical protein
LNEWKEMFDKFTAALKENKVNHVYFMGCNVAGLGGITTRQGAEFLIEFAKKSGAKVTAHTVRTITSGGKYYFIRPGNELPATITVNPNYKK